jgi:hypothetical protein
MGGDCLEDLDSFKNDDLFLKVHEKVIASTTAGKFLRSFDERQVEKLEDNLIKLAMRARMALHGGDRDFVFCNDGTFHEQDAKKMEGLGFDYNNKWGLSSLHGYDQYGFCYGFNLRGGSTHSCVGAESMIYRVFKQVPEGLNRYFLGDSAYGSLSIFNQLIASKAKFIIPLKENVYRPLMGKNVLSWSKTDLKFMKSENCETSECQYYLEDLGGCSKYLRVVFIRTPKKEEQLDLLGENYHYYAFATNMDGTEKTQEQIILFYRQRGNFENFIRETKNNFDLKHFPCQKLLANQVYGLIGMVSHNLMRFISFLLSENGHYAKKTRKLILFIGSQVVEHARSLTLKLSSRARGVLGEITKKLNSDIKFYRLLET